MRLPSAAFILGAVLVAVAAARPAAAHKGHAHASPSPSVSPVASPTATLASPDSAGAAPSPVTVAPSPAASPAVVGIDWNAALFEHVHNKIVHFPIALGLSAAVILLGRGRWGAYQPVAAALL